MSLKCIFWVKNNVLITPHALSWKNGTRSRHFWLICLRHYSFLQFAKQCVGEVDQTNAQGKLYLTYFLALTNCLYSKGLTKCPKIRPRNIYVHMLAIGILPGICGTDIIWETDAQIHPNTYNRCDQTAVFNPCLRFLSSSAPYQQVNTTFAWCLAFRIRQAFCSLQLRSKWCGQLQHPSTLSSIDFEERQKVRALASGMR